MSNTRNLGSLKYDTIAVALFRIFL